MKLYLTDFGHEKGWALDPAPVAVTAWENPWRIPPEKNDPYLRQAFRDVEVLEPGLALPGGETFVSLARRIYEPYLLARVEQP